MPNTILPELTANERLEFHKLAQMVTYGELVLIRFREVSTNLPVAALCKLERGPEETLITPVARLINEEDRTSIVVEDKY